MSNHDPNLDLPGRFEAALAGVADPALSSSVRIDHLAHLIDLSHVMRRPDGTQKAIAAGAALLAEELASSECALVHYFLGNAHADVRTLTRSGWNVEAWEQPEIAAQVIHLRTALAVGQSGALPPERITQVLTNLGNVMSHCGRTVEAIAYWDHALALDPSHGMARGNRGMGFERLARLAHDSGHRRVMMFAAYVDLRRAIEEPLEGGARDAFNATLRRLEDFTPPGFFDRIDLAYEWPTAMPVDERGYREWCLSHRLFLNDLNAIGENPLAAADVLMLPTLVTALDVGPGLLGYYNQMKQEYAAARYLLYAGLHAREPHFSDREVKLLNTLDYPAYGLGVEQVKIAFRVGYSLLDKVAYFVNEYLGLGVAPEKVSFKKIWYEKKKPHRLRSDIERPQNTPLKGLFWLSKDLFEGDPGFRNAIEPEAQELEALRHHLEHKYLKTHTAEWNGITRPRDPIEAGRIDTLARSLRQDELEARTFKVLGLARAALIYLAGAVYVEEGTRHAAAGPRRTLPIELPPYDDEWKW